MRRPLLWGIFICLAVGVAGWGVLHHPAYREWRYAGLSLSELRSQISASGDPALSDDADALYYYGRRLNEAGQFAEALPILERAAQTDMDAAHIRDALATAQMASSQPKEAFSQLKQYAATHPDSAPGHLALGKFYLAMRSGERALEELQTSVTQDAAMADGWAALSVARSDFSGDEGGALEAARRASRLRPASADDQLHVAELLVRQASPEAIPAFERAITLAPENPGVHARFADCLLRQGGEANRAWAEAEARRALRQMGNDNITAQASQILGCALTRRGADADALAPLTHAAQLSPYDPVAPRELAQLYARLGKKDESERWRRIWRERQMYLSERQRLLNAALAKPDDRERCARYAAFLARHGEMEEAVRYQGLAEGGSLSSPDALFLSSRKFEGGRLQRQSRRPRPPCPRNGDRPRPARQGDATFRSFSIAAVTCAGFRPIMRVC